MEKVIVVNLNGNAFQLNEPAYALLSGYLEDAARALASDPDRAEILADIEQAIADKCAPFLGAHKTVLLEAEARKIVAEMGPVADAVDDKPSSEADERHAPSPPEGEPVKRLYQISEGAMISGVCNGIAAYLNLDVTIVRVVFVLLALLTSGVWGLVYLVLMFVIPYAQTTAERAAAQGAPFNAQELVEQAKQKYAAFAEGKRWKWQAKHRRHAKALKRHWQPAYPDKDSSPSERPRRTSYAAQILGGFAAPVFVILGAAAFVALAAALISLLMTGSILQWMLPKEIPLWAAILGLVLLYHFIAWPIQAAQRASFSAMGYGRARSTFAEILIGLGFGALFFWLAYSHIPAVQNFVHDFPNVWTPLWESLRNSFNSGSHPRQIT